MISRISSAAVLVAMLAGLAGCGTQPRPVDQSEYFTGAGFEGAPPVGAPGLLGDGGLSFGVNKNGPADQAAGVGGALGVNAYLWRAALDTLSFMPLSSADPFGGVIITDWYQPPATPGERFKVTAYILGRQLRADAVRVSVFRQTQQNGQWVDASVSNTTTGDMENKVLARARELRSQSASQ
jgi:hypothetical protein